MVESRSPKPIIEVRPLFPRFNCIYFRKFFMVREKEIHLISTSSSIIFIRLVLPAGEAVSAPPLSATLGQVGVSSNDFCKQFNLLSLDSYEPGVLLNVHLFKNSDGTFFIRIRGLFSPFLFFQLSDESKFIPVENLFDLFLYFFSSTPPISPCKVAGSENFSVLSAGGFAQAKQFFGAIRSMGFKVIFLFSLTRYQ